MTPDQLQMLQELYAWMQEKKNQQLSCPVDDASRNALGAVVVTGAGSTAKTQVYTDSHGDTVTAPKAYAQTFILVSNGIQYEVPSLI